MFHDDQHGTAIVVGAAAINALRVPEKAIEDVKIVSTGGGAAGIACLNMLIKLGARRENIWLCDLHGLVHEGREVDMNPEKAAFAQAGGHRTLGDVIDGADLFLGLSGPGVLKGEMVARMAASPIIFALANPNPEIDPAEARAANPDAIIATGPVGLSEPGQQRPLLPVHLPRRARRRRDRDQRRDGGRLRRGDRGARARLLERRGGGGLPGRAAAASGRDYLIPKAFDPRLLAIVAGAVAEAAMATGVATRPVADLEAYKAELNRRSSARPSSCAGCSRWRAPAGGASSSPRARTSGCCTRPSR